MTTLGHVLDWASNIVSLVYLIALGFIRGTAGANRYGADPLASATMTAANRN